MRPARRAYWLLRSRLRTTPLRRLWVWRRHLGLDSSDVLIACYPRSASNWLQFLLYQALTGQDPTFRSVQAFSPYLGMHRRALRLLPGGARLIKTHEPFHEIYRRAVLLVRDPRDVVLSDYHFLTMRGDFVGPFGEFLEEFFAGRAHGIGSWAKHLESWLGGRLSQGRLHILRYETLRRAPEAELAGVLRFLGIEDSGLDLAAICRNNSIERMRAKEQEEAGLATHRAGRSRFVNRGLVGGWQTELAPDHRRRIEAAFGQAMARAGYPPGQVQD